MEINKTCIKDVKKVFEEYLLALDYSKKNSINISLDFLPIGEIHVRTRRCTVFARNRSCTLEKRVKSRTFHSAFERHITCHMPLGRFFSWEIFSSSSYRQYCLRLLCQILSRFSRKPPVARVA